MNPPRIAMRLSPVRLLAVAAMLPLVFFAGTRFASTVVHVDHAAGNHWFAPYVDVTLHPTYDFQDVTQNPSSDLVLAFVVAAPDDPCTPSWGAQADLEAADTSLELDRRIARVREQGGDVMVSFGGVAHDELANVCTDVDKLAAAYQSVIDRYHLSMIDLDLEKKGLDGPAVERRATAIAKVQADAATSRRRIGVWLTLPVAPTGLTETGVAALRTMVAAGVDVSGVNLLTMDYGHSREHGTTFVSASISAVDAAAQQFVEVETRSGHRLRLNDAYARIGVTPMIGQNDVEADRLDTTGARQLLQQAVDRGVRRFSMWSLNRDAQCGSSVESGMAKNFCSGVGQAPHEFASIFSEGSTAMTKSPPVVHVAPIALSRASNTATTVGPFQTWRPRREYEQGSRVFWDGDVYEAKWWNEGSQPDAPVEHDWNSPWRLLGPVLPEDLNVPPSTTLPPGVYPAWSPKVGYWPGSRVEHYGIAYRAKWWTQGDDPSIDVDNPWQTPWEKIDAPATP